MNHPIAPGSFPPARGLQNEEPELSNEDDIPKDENDDGDDGDDGVSTTGVDSDAASEPPPKIERE